MIVITASFTNITKAQLLGPLDPDTAGYIEVNLGGSIFVVGGDMTAQIRFLDAENSDLSGLDSDTVYKWCFEVVAEYFQYDQIEIGDEFVRNLEVSIEPEPPTSEIYQTKLELIEATPNDLFGFLEGAAASAPGFLGDIPGISDFNWPSPFGLAPEDITYALLPFETTIPEEDISGIDLIFQSENVDPEIFLTVNFKGEGRLSAKVIPGAAVPEPSTYGLIGAGFLLLLVAIRKKATFGNQ